MLYRTCTYNIKFLILLDPLNLVECFPRWWCTLGINLLSRLLSLPFLRLDCTMDDDDDSMSMLLKSCFFVINNNDEWLFYILRRNIFVFTDYYGKYRTHTYNSWTMQCQMSQMGMNHKADKCSAWDFGKYIFTVCKYIRI